MHGPLDKLWRLFDFPAITSLLSVPYNLFRGIFLPRRTQRRKHRGPGIIQRKAAQERNRNKKNYRRICWTDNIAAIEGFYHSCYYSYYNRVTHSLLFYVPVATIFCLQDKHQPLDVYHCRTLIHINCSGNNLLPGHQGGNWKPSKQFT